MHAREHIELAALVAMNATQLVRRDMLSQSGLEQYWLASKERQSYWMNAFRRYLDTQHSGAAVQLLAWRFIRPVIQEVLASEVLTRIWTAAGSASLEHGQVLLLQSIFAGHLEARNRALNVLVYSRAITTPEAAEVNRLRRRCERWCDLLLAYLPETPLLNDFTFENARRREFAHDLQQERHPLAWQMVLTSARTAFQSELRSKAACPEFNEQIFGAILSCFDCDLLDNVSSPPSFFLNRLAHRANDAEGLIEELVTLDRGG